eukprot:5271975-Prymnesium_polylepis.1
MAASDSAAPLEGRGGHTPAWGPACRLAPARYHCPRSCTTSASGLCPSPSRCRCTPGCRRAHHPARALSECAC